MALSTARGAVSPRMVGNRCGPRRGSGRPLDREGTDRSPSFGVGAVGSLAAGGRHPGVALPARVARIGHYVSHP